MLNIFYLRYCISTLLFRQTICVTSDRSLVCIVCFCILFKTFSLTYDCPAYFAYLFPKSPLVDLIFQTSPDSHHPK